MIKNITKNNLIGPHEKRTGRTGGRYKEPVQVVVDLRHDNIDIKMRMRESRCVLVRKAECVFIL